MYLQFRQGFIEADAWDGQPVPDADHQQHLEALAQAGTVVVVRSRRSDTIESVVEALPRVRAAGVLPQIAIYESPPTWDYEFRVYLTAVEWGACLTRIALDLDYRNFKHTMQDDNPREYPLALAIWQAAHRHVVREAEERERADRFNWTTAANERSEIEDARGDYERDRQQDREMFEGDR
jgi:hypothetical protein